MQAYEPAEISLFRIVESTKMSICDAELSPREVERLNTQSWRGEKSAGEKRQEVNTKWNTVRALTLFNER